METAASFKEVAERGLAKIKARQEAEQNTLTLVERYLIDGDFNKAKKIVLENLRGKPRIAENIFLKYPPQNKFCEKCKYEIKPIFIPFYLRWEYTSCPNCLRNKIKSQIKDLCPRIMWDRGVPKRFINAKLDDFPKEYQHIRKIETGIFLYGPRGVGKTHLMAAIMREKILNTEPVKLGGSYDSDIEYVLPNDYNYPTFLTVPELLLEIRRSYSNDNNGGELEIIKKYSGVKFLFLDDLGTEKTTEWAIQTLFLLLMQLGSQDYL